MKISCGQARDELALEVGQDLETGLGPELRQHLADCPECCRAWLALQKSHDRLQQLRNDSSVVESPGLWTNIETVIQSRGLKPERSSFPSWLLGVAVAVLFAVFVLDLFRSSVTGDEMLVFGLPLERELISRDVRYRPQWPLVAEPELVEVELPRDGSWNVIPSVRRIRRPSDLQPAAEVLPRVSNSSAFVITSPSAPKRRLRPSSRFRVTRPSHMFVRTGF
ncbi:MAG TPA: hypothetical protein DCE43_10195 [Planctomycetaceae bacterium]|nr:hypothetical protein [Planctomycetaceae bacterium]HCK52827.1 hypothetical protein [Planctomycetaceae bacterium]|tara:strand:- start:864 stop:1529 length:666 start_codon:yes stop_codon:yes gene_type:complete